MAGDPGLEVRGSGNAEFSDGKKGTRQPAFEKPELRRKKIRSVASTKARKYCMVKLALIGNIRQADHKISGSRSIVEDLSK
jgi:hypothetical protein